MPTLLTGTAADPTTSPTATGPASGDAISAGPMDTSALQPLLNYIAWLRTHGALLDSPNTFSASETFNAAVTIAALLSLSSNNVSLTAAVLQSILKSGLGGLDIGTSIASDLRVLLNNVAKFTFQASSGNLVSAGGTVTGLPAPVNATDAVIKSYVDTRGVRAWGYLSLGAVGAVSVSGGFNVASASYATNVLTVNFSTVMPSTNYSVVCSLGAAAAPNNAAIYPAPSWGTGSFTMVQNNVTSGAAINFVNGQFVFFQSFA